MSGNRGFVIYTDGSYNHTMRYGGWGLHGYIYTDTVSKKGTGNAQAKPTAKGYISAVNTQVSKSDSLVTIESYIEGAGPIKPATSSGNAELVAVQSAMQYVLDHELRAEATHATFITDNEYVVKGITKYLAKWKHNDYKGSKGVTIKHDDIWRNISSMLDRLRDDKITVLVYHIPGHAGDMGNTITDTLAKMGARYASMDSTYSYITPYQAQGFWSRRSDPNPLLSVGRWYTGTGESLQLLSVPENYTPYYLGNHGSGFEDELWGKPTAGNMVGIVYAKQPDPILTTLQALIERIDVDHSERVYIGRLDRIYTPRYAVPLIEHGDHAVYHASPDSRSNRRDVYAIADMVPLMIEMHPPILAFNGVESINNLQTLFNEYLDKHPKFVATDITDLLFADKGKKLECIAPEVLTVDLRYCLDDIPGTGEVYADDRISVLPTTLHYKIDLPDINVFKKLTTEDPVVKVITWRLGPQWFRHAVVIETSFGVSIWTAPHGSDVIVPPTPV